MDTHFTQLSRYSPPPPASDSQKFCSPSRSSLQSGRETRHVNVFNLDPPVYNLSDPVSGFCACTCAGVM